MAAGRYRHYAGVARLAGMNLAAEELDRRAVQRARGQRVTSRLRSIAIPSEATHVRGSQTFGGIQWRLGEEAASETWFYQAADIGRLNSILDNDIFPACEPIDPDTEPPITEAKAASDVNNRMAEHTRSDSVADAGGGAAYIESVLPDGSYFGVGTGPRPNFQVVNVRETMLDRFHLDRR